MLATRADDCAAALAFCNQVGGQDELVFDGRSAVFDAAGGIVARAPQFEEHLLIADIDPVLSKRRRLREPLARRLPGAQPPRDVVVTANPPAAPTTGASGRASELHDAAEVWAALTLGLRDYSTRTASPAESSASPAASTRRWRPASPPTPRRQVASPPSCPPPLLR